MTVLRCIVRTWEVLILRNSLSRPRIGVEHLHILPLNDAILMCIIPSAMCFSIRQNAFGHAEESLSEPDTRVFLPDD